MKTYSVTIQAIIEKTFLIEAEDANQAYDEAHDLFNPYSGEAEVLHETNTLDIKEVN
jgi:hypothetical protein